MIVLRGSCPRGSCPRGSCPVTLRVRILSVAQELNIKVILIADFLNLPIRASRHRRLPAQTLILFAQGTREWLNARLWAQRYT